MLVTEQGTTLEQRTELHTNFFVRVDGLWANVPTMTVSREIRQIHNHLEGTWAIYWPYLMIRLVKGEVWVRYIDLYNARPDNDPKFSPELTELLKRFCPKGRQNHDNYNLIRGNQIQVSQLLARLEDPDCWFR